MLVYSWIGAGIGLEWRWTGAGIGLEWRWCSPAFLSTVRDAARAVLAAGLELECSWYGVGTQLERRWTTPAEGPADLFFLGHLYKVFFTLFFIEL